MSCRPLQLEAVKVTTHSSSKTVYCKFAGVCSNHFSLTIYHCVPRTSSADQSCRQCWNFFSEDWGLHVSFPPQRGFGFLTGGVASLGREKRSAQTSAHPLSQAQSGLFCVSLFVCVVLKKKGKDLRSGFWWRCCGFSWFGFVVVEDMSAGGEATSRRGDTSPTNPGNWVTTELFWFILYRRNFSPYS